MITLPRVIGHRGAAALAPENTLASIEAAAAAGAEWVEIDVRLSADGVPVLSHDAAVAAGDRRRRIARQSAAALAEHGVPTLVAALDRAVALGLGVNVEVKHCASRNGALADAVAAVLAARPPHRPDLLVSSFRPAILRRIRMRMPAIPMGLIMRRPRRGWRRLADALGCVSLHCSANMVDAADIARLKATGRMVALFTVNDPETARRLFALGVDTLFSADPARLLEIRR